ncbi:Xylose isomerase domain-containing protein TIM barrel [Desulforamulus ruminis DSM 2154]|uniref:Xylose isomerase domain-containing protein TIM barrel n=1 Tax=Desulforamulus ruminis (strain ATCC 23193 / DSM 2154 / NCIMB 8452 / DL) TaxID=696281 RepID=F6DKY2_DESRL|nr:Xylose isomerase domain-containing protein TIM barrel [Desulforamulus ruminis DSM 2154]
MVWFGSAGAPDSFYSQGYKSSLDMPAWLAARGLNAYEYQCSRGVRIREEMARELGERARQQGIRLSIHAPYYINLSTEDSEKRLKTKGYLLDSLRAAQWMGATTVVFHPGGGPGENRRQTFKRAKDCLKEILEEVAEAGLSHIFLAPETMGKVNQMGSLEEVLELCRLAPQVVPCIDFGHINAVTQGGLKEKRDFARVLDQVAEVLGHSALKHLHAHFSPIEFTRAGEKKHWTLKESHLYGPDFAPLAQLIFERKLEPIVICESQGTQAEDALVFKSLYEKQKAGE